MKFQKKVRKYLGLSPYNRYPIKTITGNQEPKLEGHGFRWETKTGKPIYYPSAYSKIGWSNMTYVHSTAYIIVGADWQP